MKPTQQNSAEQELRQLVIAMGHWFDGFAKFAMILNGRCSDLDNGQMLMIQRLAKESNQIDKFLHEWRQRYVAEAVLQVQQRLIDDGQVGNALNSLPDDFWKDYLRDDEREVLPGGYPKEKAFNLCLWNPIEMLLKSPGSLSSLGGDAGEELLRAAIDEGVVSVQIGDSTVSVVMRGSTPMLADGRTLEEVLKLDTACEVLIGGMGYAQH
jgi:hypothetical protein